MATLSNQITPELDAQQSERNFFKIMAIVMAAIIVAGFSVNLAMGRSTFAVPPVYHIHAFIFFGWVALYVAQNWLIATNNVKLHVRLGKIAYCWAPLMLVMGFAIMITSLRRSGGPFFFDQNEFLFSNALMLVLFCALVFAALRQRRYSGWHRRLMLTAMSILTGPGLGRLLPMPLLMPHAWRIMTVVTLLFPVIGMIADKRRHGRIHPAWFWGVGAVLVTQVIADIVAYSPLGVSLTQMLLAGSPGASRPMAAFMPPTP